jgi:hypothetical protein
MITTFTSLPPRPPGKPISTRVSGPLRGSRRVRSQRNHQPCARLTRSTAPLYATARYNSYLFRASLTYVYNNTQTKSRAARAFSATSARKAATQACLGILSDVSSRAALNELTLVPVRIFDEGDHRCSMFHVARVARDAPPSAYSVTPGPRTAFANTGARRAQDGPGYQAGLRFSRNDFVPSCASACCRKCACSRTKS